MLSSSQAQLTRQALGDFVVGLAVVGLVQDAVILVGQAHAAEAVVAGSHRDATNQIGALRASLAGGAVVTRETAGALGGVRTVGAILAVDAVMAACQGG